MKTSTAAPVTVNGPTPEKKAHWTQTPEGKKRMSRLQRRAHKIRKRRPRLRENGQRPQELPMTARGLSVRHLAIEGARQRLVALESERQALVRFIGDREKL